MAKIERGGAAVTLETSEPLFQVAAALNACGYDADLDKSAPVRAEVRARIREVGRGGGLILAPAHVLGPETPWENIVAFFQAADEMTCG